jgi:hypothetical protein
MSDRQPRETTESSIFNLPSGSLRESADGAEEPLRLTGKAQSAGSLQKLPSTGAQYKDEQQPEVRVSLFPIPCSLFPVLCPRGYPYPPIYIFKTLQVIT